MSKTKITKEEFLNSKIGDYFYLYEDKFGAEIGVKRRSDFINRKENPHLNVAILNIEIIKEQPPITQENLCKFQLKFNGDLPNAEFIYNDGDSKYNKLSFVGKDFFIALNGFCRFSMCKILDSRWTEENLR